MTRALVMLKMKMIFLRMIITASHELLIRFESALLLVDTKSHPRAHAAGSPEASTKAQVKADFLLVATRLPVPN